MSFTVEQIQSMHGNGGYWCQGEAVYIQAGEEVEAIASYRLRMTRGAISITSNLNTLDAFKAKSAIESKNLAYSERNQMLAAFCQMALRSGFTAGIGQHKGENWEDDWRNIVFLDLPTGQISFHIHDSELTLFAFLSAYEGEWDGHDTDTKWQRLLSL